MMKNMSPLYALCHLSMYLDYVLIWPDDGCITAEKCCLEVNHRILFNC